MPTPRYSRKDEVGRRVADSTRSCVVDGRWLVSSAVETLGSREHAQGLGAEARPRIWVHRAGQEVGKGEDGYRPAKEEEP